MSRIRMHVYIHNDSDATLNFARHELPWGEYTPDWNPPSVIRSGQRLGFQGEGESTGLFSGTEGRVWYNIIASNGNCGELYIHWNSSVIESQYGNTFHIWAPSGWEVTHSGGQGHDATLEIRLRRTVRRTVPKFNPRGREFAFTNTKWNSDLPVVSLGFLLNKLLPGVPEELGIGRFDDNWLPITHAGMGMCGGMVYAVMDYYAFHLLPPTQTEPPSSRDDALFQYIRDRLWDSFDVLGDGHRFLGYSSPHYPNGDEGLFQAAGFTRGRSWITYRDEWPKIQADIDAGKLSPVALIQTDNLDIGANHQVLAYGYEKSGQNVKLFIYDPNAPKREVIYTFDVTATDGEVHVNRYIDVVDNEHLWNGDRIWCFFRINGYTPKMPPNGRRTTSVKEAIAASTELKPPYSLRATIAGSNSGGSLTNWMHTL